MSSSGQAGILNARWVAQNPPGLLPVRECETTDADEAAETEDPRAANPPDRAE